MHKICFTISLFHASTYRWSSRARDGYLQSVMTREAVQYNFDLLTMSTWCSKHVEA